MLVSLENGSVVILSATVPRARSGTVQTGFCVLFAANFIAAEGYGGSVAAGTPLGDSCTAF